MLWGTRFPNFLHCDLNFTVTYSINTLLETVQTQINSRKHACADVVVKEAVKNSVNFTLTVVPKSAVLKFGWWI